MSPAFVRLTPFVALVAVLLVEAPGGSLPLPSAPPEPAGRAAEVQRIRAHFDSVLDELPARDVATLSTSQRANRTLLLGVLRAYRDAGAFPHNYDFPDAPTPYFIDRGTGVLCAVAHLLDASGRRDIVERVAATDNNVWVPQLAGDTAFTHWLDTQGLTLAEAARIQVPYMFPSPDIVEGRSNSQFYQVGAGVALASGAATALWSTRGNADGHRLVSSLAGFGVSGVSLGLAVAGVRDGTAPRWTGPAAVLASGVSAWFATRGLQRHRTYVATKREQERRAHVAASVSPILPVAGVSGTGLAVRVRF